MTPGPGWSNPCTRWFTIYGQLQRQQMQRPLLMGDDQIGWPTAETNYASKQVFIFFIFYFLFILGGDLLCGFGVACLSRGLGIGLYVFVVCVVGLGIVGKTHQPRTPLHPTSLHLPPKSHNINTPTTRCFSVALQAPNDRDKRMAALDVVNISIKIYFRLNTLRLCRNLTRTVSSRQFPPLGSFPASQVVTYRFYVGRLAVFDEDYKEAEASLSFALRNCPPSAQRNRERVLKYLVPVQMLLGRLPSAKLLAASGGGGAVGRYSIFVSAMRHGDVAGFERAMEEGQFAFIQEVGFFFLIIIF
jgi:hypothetical protein